MALAHRCCVDWPDILIKTDRLVLRAVNMGDAETINQHMQDYSMVKMFRSIAYPQQLEQTATWISGLADEEHRISPPFAIELRGAFVGLVDVGKRDSDGYPELGYWLTKDHRGKGYMHEAAYAAIDWLFRMFNVDALTAHVFADNVASRRVIDCLGFQVMGEGFAFSRGRDCEVANIRTLLTRADFVKQGK